MHGHFADCHDIYLRGFRTAGVYQVKPDSAGQLDNVYCEMLNGTGWTLIQRRRDGTLSFNRRWLEYKYGFGNLYGEFWVGNQVSSSLKSESTTRGAARPQTLGGIGRANLPTVPIHPKQYTRGGSRAPPPPVADPGGSRGSGPPLLGHDVGILTLGPKLDTPLFCL